MRCHSMDEYDWIDDDDNEQVSYSCLLPTVFGDDAVDLDDDGRPIRCVQCRKACEVQP